MYQSKDKQTRLLQLKLRNMGKRKKLFEEYKSKPLEELKALQKKGNDWIFETMSKLDSQDNQDLEDKFDQFLIRFEVLEDVIFFLEHGYRA